MDNPVTATLASLCKQEWHNTRSVKLINCLIDGDPQTTQENCIEWITRDQEWERFLELLKGDWKEQLGDLEDYYKSVEEEDEDSDSE